MTTNQNPTTDNQPTDDDTEDHGGRWNGKAMPAGELTDVDDTQGHSGLGYSRSGLDDEAAGTSTIRPEDTDPGLRGGW